MTFNELREELSRLDQNNVGTWPFWAYLSAIVILSVAIIGGGSWYFVYSEGARADTLEQVTQKEQELRSTFEIKQKKVANLDAYKAQLAEMERSFGTMLRQLPSETEVPQLLNDISQTRIASGLEEELFKPRGEVPRDFYAELPNDLHVTGDYHELGEFVSGVAALPRIVTLHNVNIKPLGKDSDGLRMTVIAKTYRYMEENEGG